MDITSEVSGGAQPLSVGLLTGGSDKHYAHGLASALSACGVFVDFIGSDELDCPEVHGIRNLTFFNLRGDQSERVGLMKKVTRVLMYYGRLLRYAAAAKPAILHILWNNKFEAFDRTLLMAYYRVVGKRIVLTAHNVNTAARNGSDTWINRLSLRIQYRLCHHIFVHTDSMKGQLVADFAVSGDRVTVIPYGINDTIPRSDMSQATARQSLGISVDERTLLFFGQIAPYKGLEYLVTAVAALADAGERVCLVVAGKVKRGSEAYWAEVRQSIGDLGIGHLVLQRVQFIPDADIERHFKAADAVVMPYVDIFQSGVLFLAFSFGLPVIATDVGSLKEDVTGDTGVLCEPRNPVDIARAISNFYNSPLHHDADAVRQRIRRIAEERHSWETVADRVTAVYASLTSHLRSAACVSPTSEHEV